MTVLCKNDLKCKDVKPDDFAVAAGESRREMFDALTLLRWKINGLDGEVGKVFDLINAWYEKSSVEQTDLIAPTNNNTLLRIRLSFSMATRRLRLPATRLPRARLLLRRRRLAAAQRRQPAAARLRRQLPRARLRMP